MIGKVRHCTNHLLIFAGRLQLVNSVLFAIANVWMQSVPFPKRIIHNAEEICRSFLWSRWDKSTRKSPVSWDQTFSPKNKGGLNVIHLKVWRNVNLLKMLWNLRGKSDSLWIKWIYCYYVKNVDIMNVPIKASCSWILRAILNQRQNVEHIPCWTRMMQQEKFKAREVYKDL